MKDEVRANIINELAALKLKMYSLVMVVDKENKKTKGVNENAVDSMRHKEYVICVFGQNKMMRHNMKIIQSKLHEIGTYNIYKISLSCFDDKHYILNDGINSFAYFYGGCIKSVVNILRA